MCLFVFDAITHPSSMKTDPSRMLDAVPHPSSTQRDPSQMSRRAHAVPLTPPPFFEHGDRPIAGVCACLMPFEHGETPTHLSSSHFEQQYPPHHPLLLEMRVMRACSHTSTLLYYFVICNFCCLFLPMSQMFSK